MLEHIGTWTGLGKEDVDDNFHQLLLRDSENDYHLHRVKREHYLQVEVTWQ